RRSPQPKADATLGQGWRCRCGCHAIGHFGESACALRSVRAVILIRPAWFLLVAGILMLAVSACAFGSEFPPPPPYPPCVLPVTVSSDGRIITVRAAKPCGHRPRLIARSCPRRVTLRLANRDVTDCHVEAAGVIAVSVMLPSPLGTRSLVQATTGKPIKYQ